MTRDSLLNGCLFVQAGGRVGLAVLWLCPGKDTRHVSVCHLQLSNGMRTLLIFEHRMLSLDTIVQIYVS